MSTKNFVGKTAIVTGASAGFGFTISLALAKAGARVFAVARRKEKLEALAKENAQIIPVVQDVTKDLANLTKAVADEKIDILINNAGLALGREPFHEAPESQWRTMLDTNLAGLFAVTQMILPKLVAQGSGDIVNLGSIAAYQTYAGGSVYCATKHAVRAFSEGLRHDLLGKNIRVISIHPGMAETEFSIVRFSGDAEKARNVYAGMIPLSATDVAETVLWSLSNPRHVTISDLVVMPTDQAGLSRDSIFRRS